jgi:predicted PurR-regulated permease PerM
MKTISRQLCSFAMALALAAGLLAVAPVASASAIPSTAILSDTTRATDLATIQQALESKQVQQRLGELGFTDAEIQQRLANANDTELHQLATQSQAIMAGGDGGIIITVLLIVLLVMVILRLR